MRSTFEVAAGNVPERGKVLFLHGLTGSPQEGMLLGEYLAERGYSFYAPLLPGHERCVEELARTRAVEWIDAARSAVQRFEKESGPLAVIGLSLGALFALVLLGERPERFSGVVALSPPFRLRSNFNESLLKFLSYLPEPVIDRLWYSKKRSDRYARLVLPRNSFDRHAVSAAVRLMQVRRKVLASMQQCETPVLILQDPADSYVNPAGLSQLGVHSNVEVVSIPGGEHQLLQGPQHSQVYEHIFKFLESSRRRIDAA
jgi:esterase/lipase